MADDTTEAPKRRGHAHSEETKEKIRRSNTGKQFSNEHKANISSAKLKNSKRTVPTCHPDRPICARGMCRSCYMVAYSLSYRTKNAAAIATKDREWAAANPERKRELRNASAARNPATRLAANLRKTLIGRGLTADEYTALLVNQEGVCAICRNGCDVHQRLSVDHDHITGRTRGLLCNRCNLCILSDNSLTGRLRDVPLLSAEAMRYLATH